MTAFVAVLICYLALLTVADLLPVLAVTGRAAPPP